MDNFDMEQCLEFYQAILKLSSVEDCEKFFIDVCTIKELKTISQRLKVARLLKNGSNYNDIVSECGASSATISRVSKCLQYGSGGYKLVLEDSEK